MDGPLCFHSARSSHPVEPRGAYDELSQRWSVDRARQAIHRDRDDLNTDQCVLVVTQKCDPHADVVIAELKAIGVKSFRLNTEDILTRYVMSWDQDSMCLTDGTGRTVAVPQGVISAYLRHSLPVVPHEDLSDPASRLFSAAEGERLLDALHALEGVRWLSPLSTLRRAKPKMPQLHLARRLGLSVPRSLATSDPERAREFARALPGDIAIKAQDTPHVELDGERLEFFCSRMTTAEFVTVADAARFAPCLLQEFVDKAADIRVTIIGSDVFATEIDTTGLDEARSDWRLADLEEARYKAIGLPRDLQQTLKRFLRCYDLQFGAIDLVRTPNGQYVFLENNPNGVWYWLELATGQPMAASVARLLAGNDTQGSGAY